jgi:preprotein translocase subunit Sss1
MTLTLIVAGIVLIMIVLVGAIGYWIDESEEPLEHGERRSERQHHV